MSRLYLLALVCVAACGGEPNGAASNDAAAPFANPAVSADSSDVAAPQHLYDLALPRLDESILELSHYRGQYVLVNFFATWCAPCRSGMPDLVALHDALHVRDFEIVGIALDEAARLGAAGEFVAEFGVPYPIVLGDRQAADALGGVFGLPASLLFGPDGRLNQRFNGLVPAADLMPHLEVILPATSASS